MGTDIQPGKIARLFAAAVLLLTAGHLACQSLRLFFGHTHVLGLVRMLDFDREHNLPSYYSAFSLGFCALLLATIALAKQGDRQAGYWWGLAALFAFVSVDEGVGLHEKLILPLKNALGTSGLLFYAWVIPYGLLVAVLGAVYLRFLLSLPPATRSQFFLSATVYLSGALGLELFGGRYYEGHQGTADLPYTLLTTAEEFLEMAGVVIFIRALLGYMASPQEGTVLRFTRASLAEERDLRAPAVATGEDSSPPSTAA
jgi:hypothetical protein